MNKKTQYEQKGSKSVYSFIYKMRIQKAPAYRFDVFANIIFQCIAMFATAFFWKAIYSGYDSVQRIKPWKGS